MCPEQSLTPNRRAKRGGLVYRAFRGHANQSVYTKIVPEPRDRFVPTSLAPNTGMYICRRAERLCETGARTHVSATCKWSYVLFDYFANLVWSPAALWSTLTIHHFNTWALGWCFSENRFGAEVSSLMGESNFLQDAREKGLANIHQCLGDKE